MFGALIKTYYADKLGVDPENIVSVALMPCSAKKFECNRPEMHDSGYKDVDFGLTTRELGKMFKEAGLHVPSLPKSDFDDPFGTATGSGVIFGATGGVMEAALRTVLEMVTGEKVESIYEHGDIIPVRGFEGVKYAEITVPKVGPVPDIVAHLVPNWDWLNGATLKVAVAHGTANAKKVMDDIKAGGKFSECHFIEFMACPGGCLGGGGQPIPTNADDPGGPGQGHLLARTAPTPCASRTRTRPCCRRTPSSSPTARAGTRATSSCTPSTWPAASTSRRTDDAGEPDRAAAGPPRESARRGPLRRTLGRGQDSPGRPRSRPTPAHDRGHGGADRQHTSGVRYVDPFRDAARPHRPSGPTSARILRTVNQKIAARPSLRAIVDYLFEHTQGLIPCDRIGLAFVDEKGERVTSYYNRASYEPLLIDRDYSEALRGSSLERVLAERPAAHHRRPRARTSRSIRAAARRGCSSRRGCAPASPAR